MVYVLCFTRIYLHIIHPKKELELETFLYLKSNPLSLVLTRVGNSFIIDNTMTRLEV
jgi:hypothetical protein